MTREEERRPEVPGMLQLPQTIYQGLRKDHKTPDVINRVDPVFMGNR